MVNELETINTVNNLSEKSMEKIGGEEKNCWIFNSFRVVDVEECKCLKLKT